MPKLFGCHSLLVRLERFYLLVSGMYDWTTGRNSINGFLNGFAPADELSGNQRRCTTVPVLTVNIYFDVFLDEVIEHLDTKVELVL